jgi:hypothetical protein
LRCSFNLVEQERRVGERRGEKMKRVENSCKKLNLFEKSEKGLKTTEKSGVEERRIRKRVVAKI